MKQQLLILLLFCLMSHYRFLQAKVAPLPGPTAAPSLFAGQSGNVGLGGHATHSPAYNDADAQPAHNDCSCAIDSG